MEAESQRLIQRVLREEKLAMSSGTRTAINRLLEVALIDDAMMEGMLRSVAEESHDFKMLPPESWWGFIRWRWLRFKLEKWGVQSLSHYEFIQCICSPAQIEWLRASLQRSFERGTAGEHWWKLRVEVADAFLNKEGLGQAHEKSVRNYRNWLKNQ